LTRYWFISTTTHRRNAKLALLTLLLALVVILLGAYTRLTNAGLSCPDWPNCYGYITVPHTPTQLEGATQRFPMIPIDVKKAWTEMTHRYFAGTEGILILILSFSILLNRKTNDIKSLIIGTTLIVLLGIQVALGMLTVTEKLKPVIVLSHLLTGLSLLSILWWSYLDQPTPIHSFIHKARSRLTPWLWLALLVVASQITLGGWVSTHYAGLACIDFPYCNGKILPALQWAHINTDLITIHMLHRLGALVTATYIGLLALYLLRIPCWRPTGFLILALLSLQITLGVLNIVWLRPVWIALIHHAVAIFLLLTIIMALVKGHLNPEDHS
jgi:cytochrome c oxidase assembly protein subunit 15